jgi:nucleoside-diphosphate-sugar epimerase
VKCNLEGRNTASSATRASRCATTSTRSTSPASWHAFVAAPRAGEVYNLGGGKANSTSILEAFKIAEKFTGKAQVFTYVEQNRAGDHICYYSDLRKMRAHYPKWDITQSLRKPSARSSRPGRRGRNNAPPAMRILITGICGFVGSTVARALHTAGHEVSGFDNYIRPGSETNTAPLAKLGIKVLTADLRDAAAMAALPAADFVVDAAANPSVLAGVDGKTSSRELVDHNLTGTINVLEYCKAHKAGFILLSTSRVYSIAPLAGLAVAAVDHAFRPSPQSLTPSVPGLSPAGLGENFATRPPPSRSTAPPSSPARRSPSNTARRSACRSSSTAAACSPAPGSSAAPTRASSPTGSTPGCGGAR